MVEKQKQRMPATNGQSAEEALDSLNMELRTKSNTNLSHRRLMEAGIEAKARKRRSNEATVSSALKPKVSK